MLGPHFSPTHGRHARGLRRRGTCIPIRFSAPIWGTPPLLAMRPRKRVIGARYLQQKTASAGRLAARLARCIGLLDRGTRRRRRPMQMPGRRLGRCHGRSAEMAEGAEAAPLNGQNCFPIPAFFLEAIPAVLFQQSPHLLSEEACAHSAGGREALAVLIKQLDRQVTIIAVFDHMAIQAHQSRDNGAKLAQNLVLRGRFDMTAGHVGFSDVPDAGFLIICTQYLNDHGDSLPALSPPFRPGASVKAAMADPGRRMARRGTEDHFLIVCPQV